MKYRIITVPFLPLIFLMHLLFSCEGKPKIKPEKGSIDIITNVYFEASKGLDNNKSFHVSNINYYHEEMLELVPDVEYPEINSNAFYIKDSLFYDLGNPDYVDKINIADVIATTKSRKINMKKIGILFHIDIPEYEKRKNISDTVLFGKNYKRFEVKTPTTFSMYYIYPTDTILPFSISEKAEKDYAGRIERIDTYDYKEDMFVSLQLFSKQNWNDKAKAFFDFNEYIRKTKK